MIDTLTILPEDPYQRVIALDDLEWAELPPDHVDDNGLTSRNMLEIFFPEQSPEHEKKIKHDFAHAAHENSSSERSLSSSLVGAISSVIAEFAAAASEIAQPVIKYVEDTIKPAMKHFMEQGWRLTQRVAYNLSNFIHPTQPAALLAGHTPSGSRSARADL